MPKATSVQNFKGVGRGLEKFFRGVRPFSSVRPLGMRAYVQSVRKVWKFGRNLDIWVPMAAAPAPVSQQGEEFDVSFSKPVDSCTTSPEAISEPADLSLRKSFACHKIKRILEWW